MVIQVQSTSTAAPPARSQPTTTQQPRRVPQLAGLAIVGLVVLNLVAWLLPLVSEYSAIGDNISELVLGRFGFIQTAAFLLGGVGILGLAYVIRTLTRGNLGSLVGSLLIAIYGAGAIIVAIFPTEQVDTGADVWSQGTAGTIHIVAATISFICAVAGMFILTHGTFRRAAGWCTLPVWLMALFPSGALALLLGQSEGPWVGLMQRLLVGVISTWLIVVALKARSIAGSEAAHLSHPAGDPAIAGRRVTAQ